MVNRVFNSTILFANHQKNMDEDILFYFNLISCHYIFFPKSAFFMNTPVCISIIFFVNSMEARYFILIRNQANTMNADGIRDDGSCEYNCLYFTPTKRHCESEY